MLDQPFNPIFETGILELIGVDERVDNNEYGGSVEMPVALANTPPASGEIIAATFLSTVDGSGAIQEPDGTLYIFDADPATTAGDSDVTAAERATLVGLIEITTSDTWHSDGNGSTFHKRLTTPLPFHEVSSLYLVWFQDAAGSFNDAPGDDEQFEVNLWYRRES